VKLFRLRPADISQRERLQLMLDGNYFIPDPFGDRNRHKQAQALIENFVRHHLHSTLET
jgi:hypothetical protein